MHKSNDAEFQKLIDLHVHTYYSDGTYSPSEVVKMASGVGLSAVGIADHDSVGGIEEAIQAGKEAGIEIVPAVELSAYQGSHELHILGYFVDWKDEHFVSKLKMLADARYERACIIIDKLKQVGVNISIEELKCITGKDCVGRVHIAKILLKKGYVKGIQDSFSKYIGKGRPAYAEKYRLSASEASKMIRDNGGIAVLAHPGLIKERSIVKSVIDAGVEGIEAFHIDHTANARSFAMRTAEKYGLLITGGSDCHGLGKDKILMGKVKVPYDLLSKMKERLKDRDS